MNTSHEYQQIVDRLRKVPYSTLDAFAKRAGVPESTLRKIRTRETKQPAWETVEKIRNALKAIKL